MKIVDKKRVRTARGGRRHRSGWMAQLFRGLLLEGLGIAVLAYLFITTQSTPATSHNGSPAESILAERGHATAIIETPPMKAVGAWRSDSPRDLVNRLIPSYCGAAFWHLGR